MRKIQGIKIDPNYKEALAALASRKEFDVFKQLMLIEENNILVTSFRIPSNDKDLAIKKAQLEGRIAELKIFKRTFEEARKSTEDE